MKKKEYEVIIVGAGPAGIFTALELSKKNNMSILILEKGKELDQRVCQMRSKKGGGFIFLPGYYLPGGGGPGALGMVK